jgi:hypothetical protein
MKTLLKYTFAILLVTNFLYSCKDDETDIPDDPKKTEGTVGVETILPEGSNADLSGAVVYSLGSISELNSSQTGQLPYNENSIELAYLLDDKNNVLLEGAKSYKGRVLKKGGTYANEFTLANLTKNGEELEYKLGVGSLSFYKTCNESEANVEQQKKLDYLDEVGHQGIEITPGF